MSQIKIGKYTLPLGLFLAPLAGVSDRPFRDVCRRMGTEYTVSEMVSAKALCYEQQCKKALKTAPLASVFGREMPMAIQLFGHEESFLADAARMIEEKSYHGCLSDTAPAAIDINMGCPVHKVTACGEGSALMKDPILAEKLVRAVAKAVSLPVTVKIRAGWSHDTINAPEFAKRMEDAGASLITIHGRTREQLYTPGVNYEIIRKVKESVSVPVVANGDIYSAADALRVLEITGCDGIMVARGALGNPWIFAEITAALTGKPYTPPTLREKMQTAMEQMKAMAVEKGEKIAVAEGRKHLGWYIKGMEGAALARGQINTASTLEEMQTIIERFR